jgi:hypothetical protein
MSEKMEKRARGFIHKIAQEKRVDIATAMMMREFVAIRKEALDHCLAIVADEASASEEGLVFAEDIVGRIKTGATR